jgi:hypothetical protein
VQNSFTWSLQQSTSKCTSSAKATTDTFLSLSHTHTRALQVHITCCCLRGIKHVKHLQREEGEHVVIYSCESGSNKTSRCTGRRKWLLKCNLYLNVIKNMITTEQVNTINYFQHKTEHCWKLAQCYVLGFSANSFHL